MNKIVESRFFKFMVVGIVAIGNILFYTWGYPESGAKAAWEVHPLFWGMLQSIFLYAMVAYTYFGIKNV